MTDSDVDKLFKLLDMQYHNNGRPKDRITRAYWREFLKPWTYEQVRKAVIVRGRENRYYPDPPEIAAYLPKVPAEKIELTPEQRQGITCVTMDYDSLERELYAMDHTYEALCLAFHVPLDSSEDETPDNQMELLNHGVMLEEKNKEKYLASGGDESLYQPMYELLLTGCPVDAAVQTFLNMYSSKQEVDSWATATGPISVPSSTQMED